MLCGVQNASKHCLFSVYSKTPKTNQQNIKAWDRTQKFIWCFTYKYYINLDVECGRKGVWVEGKKQILAPNYIKKKKKKMMMMMNGWLPWGNVRMVKRGAEDFKLWNYCTFLNERIHLKIRKYRWFEIDKKKTLLRYKKHF